MFCSQSVHQAGFSKGKGQGLGRPFSPWEPCCGPSQHHKQLNPSPPRLRPRPPPSTTPPPPLHHQPPSPVLVGAAPPPAARCWSLLRTINCWPEQSIRLATAAASITSGISGVPVHADEPERIPYHLCLLGVSWHSLPRWALR